MRRAAGHLIRIPAAALLAALLAARAGAATYPPGFRFRTVSNDRVSVHFHDPLEPLARQAASIASEILAGHERRYAQGVGRVQLVLVDVDDQPNGYASPLPYPLVNVRAVAPDGTDGFGNHEGWLRLVLAHELAHSVHLEQARGLWRAGRGLFGRATFLFPTFDDPPCTHCALPMRAAPLRSPVPPSSSPPSASLPSPLVRTPAFLCRDQRVPPAKR